MRRTYFYAGNGMDVHRNWKFTEHLLPIPGYAGAYVIALQYKLMNGAKGEHKSWIVVPGIYGEKDFMKDRVTIDPVPQELRAVVERRVSDEGLEGKVFYWD